MRYNRSLFIRRSNSWRKRAYSVKKPSVGYAIKLNVCTTFILLPKALQGIWQQPNRERCLDSFLRFKYINLVRSISRSIALKSSLWYPFSHLKRKKREQGKHLMLEQSEKTDRYLLLLKTAQLLKSLLRLKFSLKCMPPPLKPLRRTKGRVKRKQESHLERHEFKFACLRVRLKTFLHELRL